MEKNTQPLEPGNQTLISRGCFTRNSRHIGAPGMPGLLYLCKKEPGLAASLHFYAAFHFRSILYDVFTVTSCLPMSIMQSCAYQKRMHGLHFHS